MSSSSHLCESAGNPAAFFAHKKVASRRIFRQKAFLQVIKQFKEKVKHSLVRFSNPEETVRLSLEQ